MVEYGFVRPKWYNLAARIPGLEETLLDVADIASSVITISTLNIINPRRSATHILEEDKQVAKVTGHDPVLGPLTAGLVGGVEIFLSATEQEAALVGALATLGFAAPVVEGIALAADAVIDTAIGNGIKSFHYRGAEKKGINLSAVDHAIRVSGVAPVIPVASTLGYLQWYGRASERKRLREEAKAARQAGRRK